MAKSRHGFKLKDEDRAELRQMLKGGSLKVRVTKRAMCLLKLDEGMTQKSIAQFLEITEKAIYNITRRYQNGLKSALEDEPRPGKEPLLTVKQGNQIIAMVTGQPPPGYARWAVRLIASEASARKIVLSISKDTVRELLKKHDLKPWREKNVVHSEGTIP